MEDAERLAQEAAERAMEESEDDEEDDDDGFVSEGDDPPPLPSDARTTPDLVPMQEDVADPTREGTGIEAQPGAAQASAAASVDPDTPVKALPFHWDMSGIFFTCKMASTLHNDVGEYVKKFRTKFPDVFKDETIEETLRDLPQLSLRFPSTHEGDRAVTSGMQEDGAVFKAVRVLQCTSRKAACLLCDLSGRENG